jgi:Zn ribbon nucleic-acid-binding protein
MLTVNGNKRKHSPKNALETLKTFSHSDHYSQDYHNSAIGAKCPRCGELASLVEESRVRTLFNCPKCGIFAKYKPRERLHGINRAIDALELTKALEILEIAGHREEEAIEALNLYRGMEVSHA